MPRCIYSDFNYFYKWINIFIFQMVIEGILKCVYTFNFAESQCSVVTMKSLKVSRSITSKSLSVWRRQDTKPIDIFSKETLQLLPFLEKLRYSLWIYSSVFIVIFCSNSIIWSSFTIFKHSIRNCHVCARGLVHHLSAVFH